MATGQTDSVWHGRPADVDAARLLLQPRAAAGTGRRPQPYLSFELTWAYPPKVAAREDIRVVPSRTGEAALHG